MTRYTVYEIPDYSKYLLHVAKDGTWARVYGKRMNRYVKTKVIKGVETVQLRDDDLKIHTLSLRRVTCYALLGQPPSDGCYVATLIGDDYRNPRWMLKRQHAYMVRSDTVDMDTFWHIADQLNIRKPLKHGDIKAVAEACDVNRETVVRVRRYLVEMYGYSF